MWCLSVVHHSQTIPKKPWSAWHRQSWAVWCEPGKGWRTLEEPLCLSSPENIPERSFLASMSGARAGVHPGPSEPLWWSACLWERLWALPGRTALPVNWTLRAAAPLLYPRWLPLTPVRMLNTTYTHEDTIGQVWIQTLKLHSAIVLPSSGQNK